MEKKMNFGEWVNNWLSILDLTQSWFYFASGVSDGSINRWVRGQNVRIDIFISSIEVLAKAADILFEDMIEDALATIPAYRYAIGRSL